MIDAGDYTRFKSTEVEFSRPVISCVSVSVRPTGLIKGWYLSNAIDTNWAHYKSALLTTPSNLLRSYPELDGLSSLQCGWDEFNSPVPSSVSLMNARVILGAFDRLGLSKPFIAPSPEGGVTLSFLTASSHVAVELYNDGTAAAVASRGISEPRVWEFDPVTLECGDTLNIVTSFLRD